MSENRLDTVAGGLKHDLAASGWIEGELLAAGQLRQGKAPSTIKLVTGLVLIDILGPRKSKELPKHFILAVTDREVLAFKANSGRRSNDAGPLLIRIQPGVEGHWPAGSLRMTGLDEGPRSKGGQLHITGSRGQTELPVFRPNLSGDPDTDELLATLSSV